MLFYAVWSRKGGRAGWTGSSRAENMIWISRIPGFAAHTTVPHTHHCTTAPQTQTPLPSLHHTDTSVPPHSLLQPAALPCFDLHCIVCSQYCSLLQCTRMQCCKRLQVILHSCLALPVFTQYLHYLLHIQVFAECFSIFSECCLRATVQRGRPLTCSGSGCGTLRQLNIHETSPKIRNN